MDPISGADQLVILLRQKLRERSRLAAREKTAPRTQTGGEPAGMQALQALTAVEGVDPQLLRRALVQNLMAEHFGQEMINDAQFQQIVGRVSDALAEDEDATALITRVLSELKTP
jgi:hypothetical protein